MLKRITKTPKLHILDSGLLATARGLAFERVRVDRGAFGALLESFVLSEVLKRMGASHLRLSPYHFCDRDKHEVDIVLEHDEGMLFRIEVKASATVKAADIGGLQAFAEACGEGFAFGVVLSDSTDLVAFGDRLAAASLSSRWSADAPTKNRVRQRRTVLYERFCDATRKRTNRSTTGPMLRRTADAALPLLSAASPPQSLLDDFVRSMSEELAQSRAFSVHKTVHQKPAKRWTGSDF